MGERVGRRWRRRGRLSGSDRSHWFSVVHQARRSDLPLQWPRGEEGMCGVVGRAPAFLRPAVCSAGSTIQYFGADLRGESIQCTFTPMTFLREDRGRETGGETITCVDFTTLNSKTIGAQVLYIQLLREMHSIFQFHLLN